MLVSVEKERVELEGDPEHVPLLLKELAMGKCKPAATPRAGASGLAKADRLNPSPGELEYYQEVSDGDSVLCKADATKFRICTMRISDPAQDSVPLVNQ